MVKAKVIPLRAVALGIALLPWGLYLAQQPCNGACESRDSICFEWKRIKMDSHRPVSGTAASEKALLDGCAPRMAELRTVLAYTEEGLEKYRPESPLSNWFADALMEQASVASGIHCDACIVNFGGLRVDLPKGAVVEDDLLSMVPFKNTVVVASVRGDRLFALLDTMAVRRQWEVIGGIRVVASSKGVESVTVGGKPLDRNAIYKVVTNSFIYEGGDGISIKAISEDHFDTGRYVMDVMRDYLKACTARGEKLTGRVDGRVCLRDFSAHIGPKPKFPPQSPSAAPAPSGRHCLTIIHTNDTHSHLEALRAGKHTGRGGIVERAAFLDSLRQADGKRNVLLLDAGDYSQGTPYFTIFDGDVEVEAMNRMGYDAATLGNHEWDNGPKELARRLGNASYSTVLCNYTVSDSALAACLKPYVIVRRGGLKIGILGVLTDVTEVVVKDVAHTLTYVNPVGPVNRWAEFLKKEKKCDLVIVLSHCGFSDRNPENVGDVQMASGLRNVDIIIGGHSHTDLKAPVYVDGADGRPVMIVTDWCWGLDVGQIKCIKIRKKVCNF